MAVSTVITCDANYCRTKISKTEPLAGWWCVIHNENTYPIAIEVTELIEQDFIDPKGFHFCSMSHAINSVSTIMCEMQNKAIAEAREDTAELEIVATVYSQSGDVEKPDENQA